MLEKTIKTIITKKVNNWIESIEDEELQKLIRDNTVITGGCFTSMMQNEEPKDFDIYFRTKEVALSVAKHYTIEWNNKHSNSAFALCGDMVEILPNGDILIKDSYVVDILGGDKIIKSVEENEDGEKVSYTIGEDKIDHYMVSAISRTPVDRVKIFIRSSGVASEKDEEEYELGDDPAENIEEGKENLHYRPVFISSNAITLSDKIQLVMRFYGDPEDIHSTYDFVHTKAYWTSWDKEVVIPKEVYEAVMNRTLVYTGSKYPVCSVIRMRKFIERGWKINAGQVLKMCMQISDLDLTNIDTLEDQLIGVDSLYFMHLINQFRSQKEKDNNWELTSGYVFHIIDKVFG